MKQIYTILFILISCALFSQSDEPCTATILPVGATCTLQAGTTVGSTITAAPSAPSCSLLSKDVWYSLTVPASGNITIEMSAGTISDGAMAIYGGSCAALTEISCDDDSGPGLMPALILTGLTPSATLWLRVWKYSSGTGTYSICAYEPAAVAPPANDDPCAATVLTVTTSCSATASTNLGATASVAPAPGCGGYLGGDVWFQFVVPASGSVTINTQAGTVTDGAFAIYSGTCGTLTLLACDDDGGSGVMPGIAVSGLTPGATIYIRFWENGNNVFGPFQICVYDPVVIGVSYNNDCVTATQLCTTSSFTDNSDGTGLVIDLVAANEGCLSSGERQPAWYIFQINTGGTFQLTIDPVTNSNDFDFAVWGPSPACPPATPPIRCSYSGSTNNTGINSANNLPQVDASEGALGNKWVIDMNVLASEIYVLMVDNFSMSNNGFSISFGGTATINCAPLPIQLTAFTGYAVGDYSVLNWTTQSEFNNAYFEIERASEDGEFISIGLVNGSYNSNINHDYQFTDLHPNFGNNYYRLKQYDTDGKFSYSNTITIRNKNAINFYVYPNPAKGIIYISHKEFAGSICQIEVVNTFGQSLFKSNLISSGNYQIEQCKLPTNGIYYVKFTVNSQVLIEKIVNE